MYKILHVFNKMQNKEIKGYFKMFKMKKEFH